VEAASLAPPAGLGRRRSLTGPLLRLRSDDQLLVLFRAGDEAAFGVLHDRYRPRLLAYARQMLGGSSSDAEDVLQDVFLRAAHTLRYDERPVALRAWLYRVAHNRCIDQLRRPAPDDADILAVNRGPGIDTLDAAERREDLRRLVADVRALPEQQRSALLMREMEGLSYQELADALGASVPAIKSLLVRARVGLVEANEARDTACAEIRADLAATFDRGVRTSGRTRRHLRECHGCREYRRALRVVDRRLNALMPTHPSTLLTTIAKVLGLGGASSGAAAGVGGAGGATVAGGAAASTTTTSAGIIGAAGTKVAAVMAAAAVVGGGAATVEQVERVVHPQAAHHAAAPPSTSSPAHTADIARSPIAWASGPRGETAPGPRVHPHRHHLTLVTTEPTAAVDEHVPAAPSTLEVSTGGVQAPDESTTAPAPVAPTAPAPAATTDPATPTLSATTTATSDTAPTQPPMSTSTPSGASAATAPGAVR